MAQETVDHAWYTVSLAPAGDQEEHREDAGSERIRDHAGKAHEPGKRCATVHHNPLRQQEGDHHRTHGQKEASGLAQHHLPHPLRNDGYTCLAWDVRRGCWGFLLRIQGLPYLVRHLASALGG